jgi:hypothetical protein
LNLQQSPSTTATHNINSNQVTPQNTTLPSDLSSLPQQITSNPINLDTTSNPSISLPPISQSSNPVYGQYSQSYYQPTNSLQPNPILSNPIVIENISPTQAKNTP